MTQTQQPEALRLADAVLTHDEHPRVHLYNRVAAELRRQHARIAELEDVADMAIKRIAELEAVLSAMGEKGNPVEPADIPRATDQDTHFFLAGWNGRAAQVDPHEHFRNAAATAPAYPAEGVPAQAAQPSDALIEAVDAWFAENTGLGGCSDKDVSELAEIFATHPTQPAAAPAQKGWCDGCSPDNCCGCGPAAPAK